MTDIYVVRGREEGVFGGGLKNNHGLNGCIHLLIRLFVFLFIFSVCLFVCIYSSIYSFCVALEGKVVGTCVQYWHCCCVVV